VSVVVGGTGVGSGGKRGPRGERGVVTGWVWRVWRNGGALAVKDLVYKRGKKQRIRIRFVVWCWLGACNSSDHGGCECRINGEGGVGVVEVGGIVM